MLLIGKNGAGKSSIRQALELLQKIARGVNRVGDLFDEEVVTAFAFSEQGNPSSASRFELEVELSGRQYVYKLGLERPETFREHRVFEESLDCDQKEVFSRNLAKVNFLRQGSTTSFQIDWHLVGLPIIQESSEKDPLFIFKRWLGRMILLAPRPYGMVSDSDRETLLPESGGENFAAWFAGLMAESPAAWTDISQYLKGPLPDVMDLKNPLVGRTTRSLEVHFQRNGQSFKLPFHLLSDGEKCYFLAAVVLAAKKAYGPLFCYWDEADAHLSLSEIGQFLLFLRRAFQGGSQLLITSHHTESIRHFSPENTCLVHRRSSFEPTQIRALSELQFTGDIIDALIENRLEP